jgi:hypothetical protein
MDLHVSTKNGVFGKFGSNTANAFRVVAANLLEAIKDYRHKVSRLSRNHPRTKTCLWGPRNDAAKMGHPAELFTIPRHWRHFEYSMLHSILPRDAKDGAPRRVLTQYPTGWG